MLGLVASVVVLSVFGARAQSYTATYLPSNAPDHTEDGQLGTNKCGTESSQTSMCQNAYLNSADDFCVWAPPNPGPQSAIGYTEREEVAWCMKSGYGTRLIPDGTMQGVHFVQTPDYVQITGVGDLTKLNIPAGDEGGELDPHGADGNGNPIGGLVFSSAFGELQQIHEWTNFMSASQFCFRACKPGSKATQYCGHIYDVMGCDWNMPGNYDANTFENCKGDSALPMGIYDGTTFTQGAPSTPVAHPIPSSSLCTPISSIRNGAAVSSPAPVPSSSPASSPSPSSSVPSPGLPSSVTTASQPSSTPPGSHTSSPSSSGKPPSSTGSSSPSGSGSGGSTGSDDSGASTYVVSLMLGVVAIFAVAFNAI